MASLSTTKLKTTHGDIKIFRIDGYEPYYIDKNTSSNRPPVENLSFTNNEIEDAWGGSLRNLYDNHPIIQLMNMNSYVLDLGLKNIIVDPYAESICRGVERYAWTRNGFNELMNNATFILYNEENQYKSYKHICDLNNKRPINGGGEMALVESTCVIPVLNDYPLTSIPALVICKMKYYMVNDVAKDPIGDGFRITCSGAIESYAYGEYSRVNIPQKGWFRGDTIPDGYDEGYPRTFDMPMPGQGLLRKPYTGFGVAILSFYTPNESAKNVEILTCSVLNIPTTKVNPYDIIRDENVSEVSKHLLSYSIEMTNTSYSDTIVSRNGITSVGYLGGFIEANKLQVGGVDMFQPRAKTKGVGIYALNPREMEIFIECMWYETFAEKLVKMLGAEAEGVMKISWFYGIKQEILSKCFGVTSNGDGTLTIPYPSPKIKVGNINVQGPDNLMARGNVLKAEFIEFELLPIPIQKTHNSFLDYQPYTSVDVFIPHYGYFKIDPTACMGGYVKLKYHVSVVTGVCAISIYASINGETYIMYDVVQASMSVDIPISATEMRDINAVIASGVGTVVPAVIGGIVGGVGGAAVGAGIGGFMTQNQPTTTRTGGLGSEYSILASLTNSVLIQTPIPDTSLQEYVHFIGKPKYRVKHLGEYSDNQYFKIVNSKLDSPVICPYKEEIEQLLKQGVFM